MYLNHLQPELPNLPLEVSGSHGRPLLVPQLIQRGGAKEEGVGEHIMAMGVEREVDTASSFQEGVG